MDIASLHTIDVDMGAQPRPGLETTWTLFVDDLKELFKHLDVQYAIMVGHSHGGGEVTHYLEKHGTGRFKKAVLVGAVPP
jgi:pimeloyl-ACP methyl ester carboxylesterase